MTEAQQIRLDPDPLEPYLLSQGFRVGDLVIVSGQAALDEQGNVVGAGDFDAQAEQVFRNLSRVLEAGGSSLDRVVKVTIFLTDMTNFGKIVELRRPLVHAALPGRHDRRGERSRAAPSSRSRSRRSRSQGEAPATRLEVMAEPMQVTLFNDAGCPWGYSANPAFRVLEWRYGAQLEWRLVLIGLTDVAQEYVDRGYTPLRSAEGYARRFRRFGMPLAPNPRARIVGTGRSCRAIVSVRLQAPGREWAAFRALQFAFFTTTLLLDEDEAIAAALAGVEGIDVDAAIAAIDTPAVEEAYQRDRAEARSAAGSPTQLQDKHATSDGPVRYTAPSLVFEHGGRRLEAGGWQTIEAYDVIVANLIPDGERRGVPDDPLELLTAFPGGAHDPGGRAAPDAWQRRPRPRRGRGGDGAPRR